MFKLILINMLVVVSGNEISMNGDGLHVKEVSRNEDSTSFLEPMVELSSTSDYDAYAQSCNQASQSGVYTIRPSDAGPEYRVYCDVTTAGGPWMLLWAYYHVGGENNPLVEGTVPTSPTGGYSHVLLNSFVDGQGNSVFKARKTLFYCETTYHDRKIHFYTSDAVANQIAYDGNAANNDPSHWNTGYALLSDHTANLPAATTNVGNYGFTYQPFFKWGAYHWHIRGEGNRFECDDNPHSLAYTTLHQVWVNVDATVPPTSAPTGQPITQPVVSPTSSLTGEPSHPTVQPSPVQKPSRAPHKHRYVSRSPSRGPHKKTKRFPAQNKA